MLSQQFCYPFTLSPSLLPSLIPFLPQEHDCKLTREIVELVDREADLLVRDMDVASLEGLRKRIATLFLQYCKTPLFNAEAAKHIKVGIQTTVVH